MRTCDKCQYGEVRAVDFYCSTAKTNIRRKLGLNDAPCEFFAKSEKPSFSQVALSKCHEVNPDNPQAAAEAIPELLEALKFTIGQFEMLYAEAMANTSDRKRIAELATETLSYDSPADKAMRKAEGK